MVDNVTNHPNKVGITKEKPCGGNGMRFMLCQRGDSCKHFHRLLNNKNYIDPSPWPFDPMLLSSFTNKL